MPFLNHFALESYPFGLTPNPQLYFPSPQTDAMLSALCFAALRGDGLLKVTGEIGTGKTLLCHLFLGKMREHPVNTAYLNAPIAITPEQIPALVAREFGVPIGKTDPAIALRTFLLNQHAKGRRNIIVIDEAQALGVGGLEAVRLLSNLETDTDKLLQIILFGQPDLDALLHRREARQILQRVVFSFVTKPLTPDVVGTYVHYRLDECSQKPVKGRKKKTPSIISFSPRAIRMLARASGGLPRLIHILADKALLAAYARGEMKIDAPHVAVACRETSGLPFPWGFLARIGL